MSFGRPQDIIQVPKLEPKDLYERRFRRDYARLRSYNTLLEQIYHRVYATSQLSGNTSSVLYSVPPFILGLPKLDMEDCIVYLVWQLRQAGFEIKFTWPNLLFISWKHHEGSYLATKNPIVQAMAPETNVASLPKGGSQKKKGGGGFTPGPVAAQRPAVAFNEEIDIITSTKNISYGSSGGSTQGTPFGSQSAAGPRRAVDYEPPASFIQNLERPGPGREQKTGAKGNVLADLWTM